MLMRKKLLIFNATLLEVLRCEGKGEYLLNRREANSVAGQANANC